MEIKKTSSVLNIFREFLTSHHQQLQYVNRKKICINFCPGIQPVYNVADKKWNYSWLDIFLSVLKKITFFVVFPLFDIYFWYM